MRERLTGGQFLWSPDRASSISPEPDSDREEEEVDSRERLLPLKEIAETTGYSVNGLTRAIGSGKLWGIKEEKKGKNTGQLGRPAWQTSLAAVEEYVTGQPEFRRMQKLVELFGGSNEQGA